MRIHLRVWRQAGPNAPGKLEIYTADDVSPDMSFLEMLDVVNEQLIKNGEEPIAFDSDCREGICGACGFMINGRPHGPDPGTTVCQLHMRRFKDGDTITLEPWRAKAFPVVKDLVVDRSAFDRIIQAGGYTSVNTGGAPDAQRDPDPRLGRRSRVGRGAVHRLRRVRRGVQERVGGPVHVRQDRAPGPAAPGPGRAQEPRAEYGGTDGRRRLRVLFERGECEAVCPKGISLMNIATMNREYWKAVLS